MRRTRRRSGKPFSPRRGSPAEGDDRGVGGFPEERQDCAGASRHRAAARGAGGWDLHQQRRGGLVPGHSQLATRRRDTGRAHPRRTRARRQVLLSRPDRRRRLVHAPALLRDTSPLCRAASQGFRRRFTLRHRLRCSHGSHARDPRRPPRRAVGGARRARGEVGAAAVGCWLYRKLRPLLDPDSWRRRLGRNPGPRGRFRSLSPGAPSLGELSPTAVALSPLGPARFSVDPRYAAGAFPTTREAPAIHTSTWSFARLD